MLHAIKPSLSLLSDAISRVRLKVLDWHLSQLALEAPFRGELLRKRTRLAQGRLFVFPRVWKIGRLEIRWLPT